MKHFLLLAFINLVVLLNVNSQVPRNGLVAYYPFTGNTGDSSGNNNHGINYSAVLTSDRFGNSNSAYYFNGASYIGIPASKYNQPSKNYTISLWINLETASTDWEPIMAKRRSNTTSPYDSYSFTRHPSINNGKWMFGTNSVNSTITVFSNRNLSVNNWQHLCATYDGSNVKLYIDGTFEASLPMTDTVLYSTLGLYIGSNSISGQNFKGKIDDLAIYNRVISECEMNMLYYGYPGRVPPKAGFTINNSSQCLGSNFFVFSDTSTFQQNITNRIWNFNSNLIDTIQFVNKATKTYSNSGIYNVSLIIVDSFGCTDTAYKTVNVIQSSKAIFSTNKIGQCKNGNSFVFTDNSTQTNFIISRKWLFGDGTIDTVYSPTKTKSYDSVGLYQVKLITLDVNTCTDTAIQTIGVGNKPSIGFSINSTSLCEGLSFNFTDTSKVIGNVINSLWDFGDGLGSNINNPQHAYLIAGNYNVLLSTNNYGCSDTLSRKITVLPKPKSGYVLSSQYSQCLRNNLFTVNDTSSTRGGNTLTRSWNFGDNSFSLNQSENKVYTIPGVYNIYLIDKFSNGCVDSTFKRIYVNPNPKSNFSVSSNAQCLKNNVFIFTDSSTISSGYFSRVWNFGDFTQNFSNVVSKVYNNAGTFNVSLITVSNSNCTDTIIKQVTVYPRQTMGWILGNTSQCSNATSFEFTDTSAINNGVLTREWSINTIKSSTNPFHFNNNTAGLYNLKLVTSTDKGCFDTLSSQIEVKASPVVGFYYNKQSQCLNGNNFLFTDTSSISVGNFSRVWSFGNGNISTAYSINQSYNSSGNFPVKLLVTSNRNCKDSVIKTVTVYPKPQVGFTLNNAIQCTGNNLFVGSDTSTVTSGFLLHNWKIANQNSDKNPFSFNLSDYGNYVLWLIATTDNGCKDSVSKNILVKPGVRIGFSLDNPSQCLGSTFHLLDTSSALSGTTTSLWDFGNKTTSNSTAAQVKFTTAGNFIIKLTSTSSNGCVDSLMKSVEVKSLPIPDFAINNIAQCIKGNNFVFTDRSTLAGGTCAPLWKFDDNTTSTLKSVSKVYSLAGNFAVSLKSLGDNGCADSISKNITVNPSPITSVILGDNIVNRFTTSTYMVNANAGSSYQWFIDKGTGSGNSNSINVTWTLPGTGMLRVVETNNFGCFGDTIIKSVTINQGSGIHELSQQGFNVYPNPASAYVILESKQTTIQQVRLIDVSGRIIRSLDTHSNYVNLDIQDVQVGMYMLHWQDTSGQWMSRPVLIQ